MSTNFETEVIKQASMNGFHSVKAEGLATLDISTIKTAIIYYHGLWSSPSVAAYKILCETLADFPGAVDLILVDADELNNSDVHLCSKAQELFGPDIGAWGETCWIKNGKIVSRAVLHWKGYEDNFKHDATGNNRRKRPATNDEIEEIVLKETRQLIEKEIC